jgi:hypothetical protein
VIGEDVHRVITRNHINLESPTNVGPVFDVHQNDIIQRVVFVHAREVSFSDKGLEQIYAYARTLDRVFVGGAQVRNIDHLHFAAIDRLVRLPTGPEVGHDDGNQVERELSLGDNEEPRLYPEAMGEWSEIM